MFTQNATLEPEFLTDSKSATKLAKAQCTNIFIVYVYVILFSCHYLSLYYLPTDVIYS